MGEDRRAGPSAAGRARIAPRMVCSTTLGRCTSPGRPARPRFACRQDSLALKEKALGRDHPDVGVSEGNLAIALAELVAYEEALAHIDRAIRSLERAWCCPPGPGNSARKPRRDLERLGRYADARKSFERRGPSGSANSARNRSLGGRADRHRDQLPWRGESTSALALLERALKIRQAKESDPSKRAETSFALARALWASESRSRPCCGVLARRARELPHYANG